MAESSLPVTGNAEADRLLVTDPLALVVGMLLDRMFSMLQKWVTYTE